MNTSIAALKRSKSNLDTLIGELSKVAEDKIKQLEKENAKLKKSVELDPDLLALDIGKKNIK